MLDRIPNGVDGDASRTGRSPFRTCPGLTHSARWKKTAYPSLHGPGGARLPQGPVAPRGASQSPRGDQTALYCLGLNRSDPGGTQVGGVVRRAVSDRVSLRDSKQFPGLTACQSRAEPVLAFHFTAALAPLNLARAEELRAQPALTPHVFSMASGKQRHFNERLLDVLIDNLALDPLWVKNHPGYEELRAYGAIAA